MEPGDEYPQAHRIALGLFESIARRRDLDRRSSEWKALRKSIVPPATAERSTAPNTKSNAPRDDFGGRGAYVSLSPAAFEEMRDSDFSPAFAL